MQRYAETLALLVDGIARGTFPQRAPEGADYLYVTCSDNVLAPHAVATLRGVGGLP